MYLTYLLLLMHWSHLNGYLNVLVPAVLDLYAAP